MRTLRAILLVALVGAASTAHPAAAQTVLRNLTPDQVVQRMSHCGREYLLTMANGDRHRYPEITLRFKIDTGATGPERGKPALLPSGMRGDRGQVIFASVDDVRQFLVERCEGDTQ